MQPIVDFYNQYDEDSRLTVKHKTEFFVTTYFLDNFIKGNDHILDVAAGTGIYTHYYAQHGCRVEALDIVPKHIEILTKRIQENLKIDAQVGDARDLSMYDSEMFDVVFNMGAIYHIRDNEIPDCLAESIRVLKPGGYLALAYLNKYKGFESEFEKYGDLFKFYKPSEIEGYVLDKNVSIIMHSPTDDQLFKGFENYINKAIPDNTYDCFQQNVSNIEDYHFWLDENLTSQEISMIEEKFIHALIIVRKDKPSIKSFLNGTQN